MLDGLGHYNAGVKQKSPHSESHVDAYFSADVETDGPIPGPFSMLSFALVYAGSFDGRKFEHPLSLVPSISLSGEMPPMT
jgi:hypothetical protein